jgi:hypothetical protein
MLPSKTSKTPKVLVLLRLGITVTEVSKGLYLSALPRVSQVRISLDVLIFPLCQVMYLNSSYLYWFSATVISSLSDFITANPLWISENDIWKRKKNHQRITSAEKKSTTEIWKQHITNYSMIVDTIQNVKIYNFRPCLRINWRKKNLTRLQLFSNKPVFCWNFANLTLVFSQTFCKIAIFY